MPNLSENKVKMMEQNPSERIKNFSEVSLGYNEEQAREEADRCLKCKNKPCIMGCPVNVQIPDFIEKIAAGKFEEAYQIIAQTNNLPAICGRVCPQETQCEKYCVRGKKGEPVAIGRLERFAADCHLAHNTSAAQAKKVGSHKVAVIGSGPASLTCAADLAKEGVDVSVFEAFHVAGGVLMFGIPEFRLPKVLVQKEINQLKALGVKVETNMVIGKTLSIDDLKDMGYEAIFIGSGAGLPKFLNIPGENLNGVYSANEFLTRINLMKAYKFPQSVTPVNVAENVAVVGGGNVAMDAARCAKRLGAKNVYVVYRRSELEMPARAEEIHHAKEEGIIFNFLQNPTEVLGDENGWVTGLKCEIMELGEPDDTGRRKVYPKPNSSIVLDVQTVIVAIGQSPNPLIISTTEGLKTEKWGGIIVDEKTGQTSLNGVYAGGDAVTGAATVILAMGAGKKAARAILNYFKENSK